MPVRSFTAAHMLWVFLISSAGAAEKNDAHLLRLETEKVIIFKDGYCLVIKRGSAVTDEQGKIRLNDVPDAVVLGSFWATPKQGRLINMTAGSTLRSRASPESGARAGDDSSPSCDSKIPSYALAVASP